MSEKLKNKILDQISEVFLNDNYINLLELLINIRKLIENDDFLREKFSVLYFYSNWVAHFKITKSNGKKFLQNLETLLDDAAPKENINYQKLIIDILMIKELIDNMIDFIYCFGINMPIIEGDLVNGDMIISNKEDQLKFLILNGNLDVSIPFIKKEGAESRTKFLMSVFSKLENIEIVSKDLSFKIAKIETDSSKIFTEITGYQGHVGLTISTPFKCPIVQ
jgi:hypothetical protein